jgi:hypothetical protein
VAPEVTAPRAELAFNLAGIARGTHVLRLRVDGQDSLPVASDGRSVDDHQTLELT